MTLKPTDAQVARAFEIGMDDADATDHDPTGIDHRMANPLWIWTRVMGDDPVDAYEPGTLDEVTQRYAHGYSSYW